MPRKKAEVVKEAVEEGSEPTTDELGGTYLSRLDLLELNFRLERKDRLTQEESAKKNAAAVIQLQMTAQVEKLKREAIAAARAKKALEEELVTFMKELAPRYGFEYEDFKEGRVGFDDMTGLLTIYEQ
jgi:hypothetical protein